MDSIKIRELEEKETVDTTDTIVIEDNDGTKVISLKNLQSAIQKYIFFNTIDDMKAASLNEGDVVKTLGYHTIADGGGATYVIQYAPTEIDNGITIHYLDTSDTLRAHIILPGEINPLQAGAYGDGVHDDYSVLNKLIKMDLVIAFPPRTFYIGDNNYLKLYSDTKINFNHATIKGTGGIQIGLSEDASNISISNLCIEDGTIRLDRLASNISILNCTVPYININKSNNITISNCIINHIYGYYIQNINISGCTITNYASFSSVTEYSSSASVSITHMSITDCIFTTELQCGCDSGMISISRCTFKKSYNAITLCNAANVSISDITAIDVNYVICTGGYTYYPSTLVLSGIIDYTITTSGSGCLIFGGNLTILNNATYKLSYPTQSGGIRTISNNTSTTMICSKDSVYSNTSPLTVDVGTDRCLNISAYDSIVDYPLFDIEVLVNSTNNISYIGYKYKYIYGYSLSPYGYIGQVISLYSNNNTVLLVNTSDGNIKELGTSNTEVVLSRNTPVKLKYNGSYWYIIDR